MEKVIKKKWKRANRVKVPSVGKYGKKKGRQERM